MLIRTESGSVYQIDQTKRTWERITETERSGDIRTQGGSFYDLRDSEVGKRGFIIGPGLAFGARWVHTTPIVEITEENV